MVLVDEGGKLPELLTTVVRGLLTNYWYRSLVSRFVPACAYYSTTGSQFAPPKTKVAYARNKVCLCDVYSLPIDRYSVRGKICRKTSAR
jgi:hypothetical protein